MVKNCWEVKRCGRQPGGQRVGEFGECPAVREFKAHGVHRGINGGRVCWAVAGTFCDGKIQGTFVDKALGCAACDFFHSVVEEEGEQLLPVDEILRKILK